jgi:hypothetical protein
VALAEVESELQDGASSLIELKARLRAGLGLCQGRMCSPALAEVVARKTGRKLEEVRPFSVRPPVKPIPLAALLGPVEAP